MPCNIKVCFAVSRIHNIIAAQARAMPPELHTELRAALIEAVSVAIESARPKPPDAAKKG